MKKTIIILLLIGAAFASLFAFSMPVSFSNFLKSIGFFRIEKQRKVFSSRNQFLRRKLKEEFELLERYRLALMDTRKKGEADAREKNRVADLSVRMLVEKMLSESNQDTRKHIEQYNDIESQQEALNRSRQDAVEMLRRRNEQINQQMGAIFGELIDDNDINRDRLREKIRQMEDQQINLATHRQFAEDNFRNRNEAVNQQLGELVRNLSAKSDEDRQRIKEKLDNLDAQRKTIMEDRDEAERRIREKSANLDVQVSQLVDNLVDGTAEAWTRTMEKRKDQVTEYENTQGNRLDQKALLAQQKEKLEDLKKQQEKLIEKQKEQEKNNHNANLPVEKQIQK